jgi:uncharacterized protein
MKKPRSKKIWIDLDNSPHVPFFRPIIRELEKKGFTLVITVRDCAQTAELADLYHFNYRKIGRHYGKHKILKVAGTLFRSLQLLPYILKEKPGLAMSHGARSMMILARLLNIPILGIGDYEHTKGFFNINWLMIPEVIPKSSYTSVMPDSHILTYPGIKEDVYAPMFSPDPKILNDFNIPKGNLLTVIRPPAVEAHYHNHQSEILYEAVIDFLAEKGNVSMIILPRYPKQIDELKTLHKELVTKCLIIIPEKVYDGLNLIWFSDFVVSGGGTMNREAAAIHVPVYSIFRGTIGAVDRYLSQTGRLVLLESVEDVRNKIKIEKRQRPTSPEKMDNITLNTIVDHIIKIWDASYGS